MDEAGHTESLHHNRHWTNVQLSRPRWDPDSRSGREPGPKDNWGEVVIREAAPEVGKRWTGSGKHRDRPQAEGRAAGGSRVVPCAPQLTGILPRHYARFGEGPDRLVFFGVQGRQLVTGAYSRAWKRARVQVLDHEQQASSSASTPYDLRRACVSTWLEEGVSPAQAAEWAGHGLEVLMGVYARCISGREERNRGGFCELLQVRKSQSGEQRGRGGARRGARPHRAKGGPHPLPRTGVTRPNPQALGLIPAKRASRTWST